MEKFLKYNIKPIINQENNQQAKIVISPLEKGMANTLGNALRRTLLFDIPGASLFAIKINDITHEFQSIQGIKEDITQIILNLKGLVVMINENTYTDEDIDKLHIEQWPVMEINASGKSIITAADIKVPVGFDIVNPNLYICELTTSTAKLDMKLYATRGRGFNSFAQNHEIVNSLSLIATDSIFSPIIRANYIVDQTKLSKHQTGDTLTIELSTNGSISPADALAYAAKILSEHLQPIININEKINQITLMQEAKKDERNSSLSTPIEDYNFSVRSYNCLHKAGIQTIQQLTDKTKADVEKIDNLGKKSLKEIKERLNENGLTFKDEESEA